MRVAVITRHAINNYGSLLQALATQKVIESLGHDCIIIDYVRYDETYQEREKTELSKKRDWNKSRIKSIVYLLLRQPESLLAGRKFEKYQRHYLNLTKRYSSKSELIKEKPKADCYVTGSDQVWGIVGRGVLDDCYCLSFTNETDKRFSLASSFGHTDFTPSIIKYYKKWLSRYNQILVREDTAVQRISEWGLNAKQVIDPTLMLSKSFWRKYATEKKTKPYILIYQLHNNPLLGKYAKELANRYDLSLIRVSQSLHQITREGKLVWCPSINRFLSLINNAECMITDSFHGTAFAINLNTQFIEVLPNNNTSTRNMSILRMTNLTDRILTDVGNFGLFEKKIDFDNVNLIIKRERSKSKELLNTMLSQ